MTSRLMLIVGLLALAACETVGGAGRDISSAGRTVSTTAQDVQNDL